MRWPWQECKHLRRKVHRYDHGVDKRITVTCLDCKEVLSDISRARVRGCNVRR